MAFVSIMFGSFIGLLSAVTGFALFDLHIWQSLLVYSASGVGFTGLLIGFLVLRSSTEPQFSTAQTARTGANGL